jgi:hypothetical protein
VICYQNSSRDKTVLEKAPEPASATLYVCHWVFSMFQTRIKQEIKSENNETCQNCSKGGKGMRENNGGGESN